MTENIFQKDLWGDDDWDIYLNNLNILRARYGLSKKGLAQSINRANLYRKDIKHPGEATITRLCGKFNVTEGWLSTPRSQAGKKESLATNQGVVEYPNLLTRARWFSAPERPYYGEEHRKERRRRIERRQDAENQVFIDLARLKNLDKGLFLQTVGEINGRLWAAREARKDK